jgi:hypothetical protein
MILLSLRDFPHEGLAVEAARPGYPQMCLGTGPRLAPGPRLEQERPHLAVGPPRDRDLHGDRPDRDLEHRLTHDRCVLGTPPSVGPAAPWVARMQPFGACPARRGRTAIGVAAGTGPAADVDAFPDAAVRGPGRSRERGDALESVRCRRTAPKFATTFDDSCRVGILIQRNTVAISRGRGAVAPGPRQASRRAGAGWLRGPGRSPRFNPPPASSARGTPESPDGGREREIVVRRVHGDAGLRASGFLRSVDGGIVTRSGDHDKD